MAFVSPTARDKDRGGWSWETKEESKKKPQRTKYATARRRHSRVERDREEQGREALHETMKL